jgi:hypothetical protein
MLLQITIIKAGGGIMESFLATLAFLGIAMVSVCGVVVLKIYNPNSNK